MKRTASMMSSLPIRAGYKGRLAEFYSLVGMTPPTFRRKAAMPETLTISDIRRINRIAPITDPEIIELVRGK